MKEKIIRLNVKTRRHPSDQMARSCEMRVVRENGGMGLLGWVSMDIGES